MVRIPGFRFFQGVDSRIVGFGVLVWAPEALVGLQMIVIAKWLKSMMSSTY